MYDTILMITQNTFILIRSFPKHHPPKLSLPLTFGDLLFCVVLRVELRVEFAEPSPSLFARIGLHVGILVPF